MDERSNEIYVVDSIMGSGKTSALINTINSLPPDEKVIVVVLYKTELERIKNSCKSRKLQEPSYVEGRKLYGARKLLEEGQNIVTTHALLTLFEDTDVELVKSQNYVCFLDETLDCISPYSGDDEDDVIDKYDVEVLVDKYASVDDNGLLKWKVDDYEGGRFIKEKTLITNNRLVYNDGGLLIVFPIYVLQAFKKVYILTYLFDGSVMYCYLLKHGIEYKKLYITGSNYDEVMFTDDESKKGIYATDYKSLINVLDDKKLNSIGDEEYSLTVGWYQKRASKDDYKRLYLNMQNYFKNITSDKNKDCMWTTFASYKDVLVENRGKYNRYKNNFVPLNKRASNEFSNCTSIAYLVNRYMNVSVSSYFKGCGVRPKEDLFALSEMVQFVWRSAIRNGQKINIYVPSARMRRLLVDWIDKNSF